MQKQDNIRKVSIWQRIALFLGVKKPVKVYFVSGLCNSCEVFDGLILPVGFEKVYIEWLIPKEEETLDSYAHRMAAQIDLSRPFILVGYSFGGIIIQEMNKFLKPIKNIVISSITCVEEIPSLFKLAKRIHFVHLVPKSVFGASKFIAKVFSRILYDLPSDRVTELMRYTDPVYIRWSVDMITNWIPQCECRNMYHIHGTKDQIFPYKQIKKPLTVKGGDHLMVMTRSHEISMFITDILLSKD